MHTPEPWPDASIRLLRLTQDDYDRARACVNACKGLNPELVPELYEAIGEYMSQFGQGLEAAGVPFGPTQRAADTRLRAALSAIKQESTNATA